MLACTAIVDATGAAMVAGRRAGIGCMTARGELHLDVSSSTWRVRDCTIALVVASNDSTCASCPCIDVTCNSVSSMRRTSMWMAAPVAAPSCFAVCVATRASISATR